MTDTVDIRLREAMGGWWHYSEPSPSAGTTKLLASVRNHSMEATIAGQVVVLPRTSGGALVGGKLPLGYGLTFWNEGDQIVDVQDQDANLVGQVAGGTMRRFFVTGYVDGQRWLTVAASSFVAGTPLPSGFVLDLAIVNSRNSVNLLQEAIAQGYDGTVPALVVCEIGEGVVVGSGHTLVAALDVGDPIGAVSWHASSQFYLINRGTITGKGGFGGRGGAGQTGLAAGTAGGNAGAGFRVTQDIKVSNFGVIQGGGGGGGGGGGHLTNPHHGGGGGGGAGEWGGVGGLATTGPNSGATPGQPGTVTTGGAAGVGYLGGAGGAGGDPGQPGQAGTAYGGGAGNAGGLPGPAVQRKTTATITWLHTGTVGAEATF